MTAVKLTIPQILLLSMLFSYETINQRSLQLENDNLLFISCHSTDFGDWLVNNQWGSTNRDDD